MLSVASLALAACDPTIPDSGAGVGFDDYDAFEQRAAQREAELTGTAVPPAGVISGETTTTAAAQAQGQGDVVISTPVATPASNDPADIAAAAEAAIANSGAAPVQASPSNPAPEAVAASGISRENDFDAVSELRDIEADAARRTAQKEQFQQVAPTALPTRSGTDRPNIVQYALTTTNSVGQSRFTRRGFNLARKNQSNCAQYPSADLAQEDFLSLGGPDRDRKALDPDGDGFACGWDPAPFRKARAAAQATATFTPQ
ncbi:hypothetical protein L1065_04265 [Nereida sp. MMG024]|nr:hypothetical protein [Nereida sp. MMG025]MCF6443953.1 hypothetical protein [Nereida sp. MMG025]